MSKSNKTKLLFTISITNMSHAISVTELSVYADVVIMLTNRWTSQRNENSYLLKDEDVDNIT